MTDRGHRLDCCPGCGGHRWKPAFTARGIYCVGCLDCGLVYSNPQPRDRVLEKYLKEYDLAEHFGDYEARKSSLIGRRLDRIGAPPPGRSRLCDVGCGDGLFLELARDRGWEVLGIELNPPAAERVRGRGIDVVEGEVERMEDLPWGMFDVVTGWDTIEHTPEPRVFLGKMVRLMAPVGRLHLTTLNRRSLVARAFGARWSLVVEDHFTYWDQRSLRELAHQVGLAVLHERSGGLGRDFVRWVDVLRRVKASSSSTVTGGTPSRPSDWGASPAILRAESALNRLLDATATGVEIEIVAARA